jgi:PAS domain S-box-containing protein
MIATDREYRIVLLNRAAEELLGPQAGELLGGDLREAVPSDKHKLLEGLLRRAVGKRVSTQLEFHVSGDGGERRDLMVILSPILGADGDVWGIAAWIVDRTQGRRLSERLGRAERMASLGRLAGGVAHHFNNILGGVATYADYALSSGDPATMKRALQMTAEAVSRTAGITQSLLTFAERDAAQGNLADLTEVVLTFAHLVERSLAERGIGLELDLQRVPVTEVEAGSMHQVLGNLLTNAEEAMGGRGTIRLSLRKAGDRAVLTFADTGCGIAPKDLPLVFEPFFTTKGLHAGGDGVNLGLGLSVVHGKVVEMGGRIDVASAPGKGSTFTISFPLRPPAKSDEAGGT